MQGEKVISFEEFMRWALHDPKSGYYARHVAGVGRRGDFTTVPMMTRALAKAIARWLVEKSKATGIRDVVEIGPGEGRLAVEVRKSLPFPHRMRLRWHLVETSSPLKDIQQKALGKRARWYADPSEAMRACQGRALIYSNELVDAFPVRRFRLTANGWEESGVIMGNNGFAGETWIKEVTLPDSSVFSQPYRIGQLVEVHESYRRWLASWMNAWREGSMLTIDYGAEVERLHHRRPGGSMRAYLLQQRIEGMGVYQNIGRQDLTADVNFTDLMHWGEEWMINKKPQSLASFCGKEIPEWMKEEHGAGEAFLVLEQKRT